MTQTVKIGDAVVREVLHASELQDLLRQVSPQVGGGALAQCQVAVISEMEPWKVNLSGALMLGGQPHFWEVPVDMAGINSAEDIISLCRQMEVSFDKAAAQLGRPT